LDCIRRKERERKRERKREREREREGEREGEVATGVKGRSVIIMDGG